MDIADLTDLSQINIFLFQTGRGRKVIGICLAHDIREAQNHELMLGWSYFKEKIEQITQRKTELGKLVRPRVDEEFATYGAGYLVY
jgi:hypothetical protein